MPVHDWTRVSAGTFHDFHCAWIAEIRKVLNSGVLPPDYYAMAEQKPPSTSAETDEYVHKQWHVVVRHNRGDRLIALVEILSPGNKKDWYAIRSFTDNILNAISRNLHLLLIDLHPPGPNDPQGIHGVIWSEIDNRSYQDPTDKPLTLVTYEASTEPAAYIEPVTVGDNLNSMPLFLAPGFYVNVPLERAYQAAWEATPMRWRRVLEG